MGEERGTWRLLMPLLCALTISLWFASSMLRTLFPRTWVATDRGGVAPNSRRFNRRNITSHHITSLLSLLILSLSCISLLLSRALERASSRALENWFANKQRLPSCLHVIVAFSTLGNECFRTRFWTFSSSVASIKSVCALLILQASHADCGEPFERKTRSDTLPQRHTPIFFLFPTIGNPRAEFSFLVFLQENQSLFVLSVVSSTRLQMAMYSLRHCSQSVRSTNICFISICFFFFFCCNSDEGDW